MIAGGGRDALLAVAMVCLVCLTATPVASPFPSHSDGAPSTDGQAPVAASSPTPAANFTAAIQRVVSLLALSGSGLLAIVWARVALSWFSNDVTKKVQAKDRARDALIGTAIFVAAISGLLWGIAHWVVTGV